jgi:SnoaL-like domain
VGADSLTDDQLRRLWDDACIRKLPNEYADCVLVHDAARMQSLWATDVAAATPPDFDFHWAGRLPARWTTWRVTMLHVTTHSITFDGPDAAHGRVQCLVQAEHAEGFLEQTVLYEDTYVRRGEGWLFARRRHQLWFGRFPSPSPLDQEASGWPNGMDGVGSLPRDVDRLVGEHQGEIPRGPVSGVTI